jgi:hypothetical protein
VAASGSAGQGTPHIKAYSQGCGIEKAWSRALRSSHEVCRTAALHRLKRTKEKGFAGPVQSRRIRQTFYER